MKIRFRPLRFPGDFELALVFGLTALIYYFLFPYSRPTLYFERDLFRAQSILRGNFLLAGPETITGGVLPGAFYYYLLALPLLMKNSWFAEGMFFVLGQSLGALIGYILLRRFGRRQAWAFWLFYVGSAFMAWHFFLLYNPCWLPFFVLLFFATYEKFLRTNGAAWLFLSGVIAGLGVQVHGGALALIVFGITAPLLPIYCRIAARKRIFFCLCFLGALAMTIVPFNLLRPVSAAHPAGLQVPWNPSLISDVVSGLGGFFSPGSLPRVLELLAPPFLLLLVRRDREELDEGPAHLNRIACGVALCALPPAAYYLILNYVPRYGLVFYLSLIVVVALRFPGSSFSRKNGALVRAGLCVVAFLCLNVWLLQLRLAYPLPTQVEARFLAESFASIGQTNYAQARSSLYAVDMEKIAGFYNWLNESKRSGPWPGSERPHGFFLVWSQAGGGSFESLGDARQFLLDHRDAAGRALDPTVGAWLASGQVRVGKPIPAPGARFAIFPYYPSEGRLRPLHFGNVGMAYVGEREKPDPVAWGHEFRFHALGEENCGFAISVAAMNHGRESEITLSGPLLSFNASPLNPGCVGSIQAPYVEFTCGRGRRERKWRNPLVDVIGEGYFVMRATSEQLRAPVSLELQLPCVPEMLSRIAVGYKAGILRRRWHDIAFPGAELEWEMASPFADKHSRTP